MKSKIRVLVVDDSALMRREIKRMIESCDDLEVSATAHDGQEVMDGNLHESADVVTMDINMPRMDGLTTLQNIMLTAPRPVIMLSSLTQKGAVTTYEALNLGAVDWVGKPSGTISHDIGIMRDELVSKIRAAAESRVDKQLRSRGRRLHTRRDSGEGALNPQAKPRTGPVSRIVVIGQSTGGPNAIMEVLPRLPEDFPAPIIIVQHMPATFTGSFAARLNEACPLPVVLAEHNMLIENSRVYVAPGDKHLYLSVTAHPRSLRISLSPEPADTLHRPSVDITMRSALAAFGSQVTGVILTGMGSDGAQALKEVKDRGGFTIAESEETAIIFGMPREAIARGGACEVKPVYEIAETLLKKFKEG